jgi:hypothetical protein
MKSPGEPPNQKGFDFAPSEVRAALSEPVEPKLKAFVQEARWSLARPVPYGKSNYPTALQTLINLR